MTSMDESALLNMRLNICQEFLEIIQLLLLEPTEAKTCFASTIFTYYLFLTPYYLARPIITSSCVYQNRST